MRYISSARENRPVQIIQRAFRTLGDPRKIALRIGEPGVRQVHIRLGRDQPDRQPQRVAQRAVGVWKSEEQIRILPAGAGHQASVAEQDLHLFHGFVHQTELKR